ncbi:MAG: hypothetical protein ACNS60_09585 [Candidatus Cyclobacteriaceae bacterium M2_1C_046]
MSFQSENVIQLAAHWVNEIEELSNKIKIKWNNLLKICFEDELPREQILLMALQKHKIQHLDNYTDIEKLKATALLLLLKQTIAEKGDPEAKRALNQKVEQILKTTNVDEQNAYKEAQAYEKLFEGHKNRTVIHLPGTITPLLIDHAFRWIILWYFFSMNEAFVWISNTLILPAVFGLLFYLRQRYISRKNNILLEQYLPGQKVKKVRVLNAGQWTVVFALIVISIAVSFVLTTEFLTGLASAVAFIIYYGIYLWTWSEKKLSEEYLVSDLSDDYFKVELLTPQKNDEIIVEQSVALKSITGKLEAYVLESALFGALAFSGFLQIMAENLIDFDDLALFGHHLYTSFESIVYLDSEKLSSTLHSLSSKKDLFSLVALETLICSALFLIVIASRLRFTDKSDKVEESLEKARAINQKEEALLQNGKDLSDPKVKDYNRQIAQHLIKGNNDLEEITPVLAYMRYFRNAGILTFFIVIISSALFISSFISWLITIIVFASYIFFNRKEIRSFLDSLQFSIRMLFVRKGYYILLVSIIIFITGLLLRVEAHWVKTDVFIFSGLFLFGLYLFTWIVFIPHVDKKFVVPGNLEMTSNWWFSIRILWGFSLFLFVMAYNFQMLNITGAGAISMISTTLLIIVLLIIGYYLVNPRWLGILFSISISLGINGFIFKTLHFSGADELIFLSSISIIILITLTNLLRIKNKLIALIRTVGPVTLLLGVSFKTLHYEGGGIIFNIGLVLCLLTLASFYFIKPKKRYFHRIYIINGVFFVILSSTLFIDRFNFGELAYDNYTFDKAILSPAYNIDRERNMLYLKYVGGVSDVIDGNFSKFFSNHLKKVDDYLNYSRSLPAINKERELVEHYLAIALVIYEKGNDATNQELEIGCELTKRANLIGEKFGYPEDLYVNNSKVKINVDIPYLPMLELIFLERLGKQSETRAVAERFMQQEHQANPNFKVELAKYIEE